MCQSLWCKEIMEISRWHLGVVSFSNYLVIQMIYRCRVVFCLYDIMALYNICRLWAAYLLLSCVFFRMVLSFLCILLVVFPLVYSVMMDMSPLSWSICFWSLCCQAGGPPLGFLLVVGFGGGIIIIVVVIKCFEYQITIDGNAKPVVHAPHIIVISFLE